MKSRSLIPFILAAFLLLLLAAYLTWGKFHRLVFTSPIPLAATPSIVPTPDGGLLVNPSFESPYECPQHSADCVAHGWSAWWTWPPPCLPGKAGCYIPCPSNCLRPDGSCQTDWGCYWAQPEFGEATLFYPERVHSGSSAQKSFVYGRMGEWGVYQRVQVSSGAWLEFSIYGQEWMCREYDSCEGGSHSDAPATMHPKVGIDPTGGIVPTSTQIVWVGQPDSFDHYSRSPFSVIAKAQGEWVTVFVHARPEWDYARLNNDLYLDDARLVVISPLSLRFYLPLIARWK